MIKSIIRNMSFFSFESLTQVDLLREDVLEQPFFFNASDASNCNPNLVAMAFLEGAPLMDSPTFTPPMTPALLPLSTPTSDDTLSPSSIIAQPIPTCAKKQRDIAKHLPGAVRIPVMDEDEYNQYKSTYPNLVKGIQLLRRNGRNKKYCKNNRVRKAAKQNNTVAELQSRIAQLEKENDQQAEVIKQLQQLLRK